MNAAVELTATEAATRLLPLLKEYAEKLAGVAERGPRVLEQLQISFKDKSPPSALEAGRLICLQDTLEKPVTDLAREASSLVEHAALEHHLRSELKLRLDELEENIRFSSLVVGELVDRVTKHKDHGGWLRQLIEDSGRYKAPF